MLRRFLAAAVVLTLPATATLQAQAPGLPVVNSGVPVGIQLAADVGFPNADYGKGTAVGASAGIGIGYFGVGAQIVNYKPKGGESTTAAGFSASMRLLGGPLVPFRIMAMAGYSHWTDNSEGISHIPLSIGLAATIPNPAFSIKPWVAPRIDIQRAGGGTHTHFAMSAGIDLALLNGFSVRGSYDRISVSGGSPSVIALALGYALK